MSFSVCENKMVQTTSCNARGNRPSVQSNAIGDVVNDVFLLCQKKIIIFEAQGKNMFRVGVET